MDHNMEILMYITEFVVEGNVAFPIDMLRYDACYPADETSAIAIHSTMCDDDPAPIRISLKQRHHLKFPRITGGRWESMGWRIYDILPTKKGA